jgi:hypothetical protein
VKQRHRRSVGAPDDSLRRQLSIYQVLHNRYASNAGLQWQVAVYIIAAQAALLAGTIATREATPRWALGVADLTVGVLGALVCRRIELTAWIDREHLDALEDIIARGHPELKLHHADTFVERLERRGLHISNHGLLRRLDLQVARHVRPGVGLAVLMVVLGATALFVAGVQSAASKGSTASTPTHTVTDQRPDSRSSSR